MCNLCAGETELNGNETSLNFNSGYGIKIKQKKGLRARFICVMSCLLYVFALFPL